jgi:hypothetical protein
MQALGHARRGDYCQRRQRRGMIIMGDKIDGILKPILEEKSGKLLENMNA